MKPSSLAWVRLNSVPVIRAARANVTRAFVAALIVHTGKLKSLDSLEPDQLAKLNSTLAQTSNESLETPRASYTKSMLPTRSAS